MGTTWQIQLVTGTTSDSLQSLGQELAAELQRLDTGVFSTYALDSELSQLNRAPVGEATKISRELQEVLLWAQTISKQSFGAFDVTVGPLVDLWGFGPQPFGTPPASETVELTRKRVDNEGYAVNVRAGTATRLTDVQIDLSAIAKGYAVDAIAELLLDAGFVHFLVEIGGEVRSQGWPLPEHGWHIAIETPEQGVQRPYAVVDTLGEGLALAGSGDYRNFRSIEGKRYSHEIDPRTGYPVDHALASVTVLAATAAEADAWATAMMVLGPEDGPYLAEHRGLAAYFIVRSEQGWQARHTTAFAPYLLPSTSQESTHSQGITHGQAQF